MLRRAPVVTPEEHEIRRTDHYHFSISINSEPSAARYIPYPSTPTSKHNNSTKQSLQALAQTSITASPLSNERHYRLGQPLYHTTTTNSWKSHTCHSSSRLFRPPLKHNGSSKIPLRLRARYPIPVNIVRTAICSLSRSATKLFRRTDYSPTRPAGGAIESYARLMKASEALMAKQQLQSAMYQTLLQKVVLSQWKDCVERKKRLAWKVLVALRMKALSRGLSNGVRTASAWEEEAGQLCLVS